MSSINSTILSVGDGGDASRSVTSPEGQIAIDLTMPEFAFDKGLFRLPEIKKHCAQLSGGVVSQLERVIQGSDTTEVLQCAGETVGTISSLENSLLVIKRCDSIDGTSSASAAETMAQRFIEVHQVLVTFSVESLGRRDILELQCSAIPFRYTLLNLRGICERDCLGTEAIGGDVHFVRDAVRLKSELSFQAGVLSDYCHELSRSMRVDDSVRKNSDYFREELKGFVQKLELLRSLELWTQQDRSFSSIEVSASEFSLYLEFVVFCPETDLQAVDILRLKKRSTALAEKLHSMVG